MADKEGALQAKAGFRPQTGAPGHGQVLKTSGGFHTSLMEPAKAKLGQALDEVLPKMQPPGPDLSDGQR